MPTVSERSGSERVISLKSWTLAWRRPGLVGLYRLIPMTSSGLHVGNGLAFGQGDDGLLPGGATPLEAAESLELARPVHCPDGNDLDVEDLLDGAVNLDLVGVGPNLEGDDIRLLGAARHLLGDQWRDDDLVGT